MERKPKPATGLAARQSLLRRPPAAPQDLTPAAARHRPKKPPPPQPQPGDMQNPFGPQTWPPPQQLLPHTVPVQQIPLMQLCPGWQQPVAPHTTVPGGQQPPPGSGVPVQHWLTEQIWPLAQHWEPHTVPAGRQEGNVRGRKVGRRVAGFE